MVKFIKEHKLFSGIFILAVVIRFLPAFSYQFSYDELCGLRNTIYPNWQQMIDFGVKLDTHPILVQVIINVTVKIFGYNAFWVKLPFLLFSLAAIIYAYLFSYKWFGKAPALITAVIFSYSYIFLFYAPLARMYSGGLFFSTALMYYLFELCFSETKKMAHYAYFVIFLLLCALNNHLSALFAFTAAFAGLFFQSKKTITYYFWACLTAVVLYLPHISITMWQFAQGGIGHRQDGWLAVPDKWVLFSFLKTLLGTGYVWMLFALLLLISFINKESGNNNKARMLLLLLFLVNYGIIHAYSVFKAPVFQNSVMLFSAPCFVWVLTSYYNFSNLLKGPVVVIVTIGTLFQSLYVKDFFNNAVLNQNEFQSKQYVKLENQYGKKNVEAFYMGSQRYFVIESELKHKRKFNYYVGEEFADLSAFVKRMKESNAQYVLLGEPENIQVEVVKDYFPYLVEGKQTLNVNYYLFSRVKTETPAVLERIAGKSTISIPNGFEYQFNPDKFVKTSGGFIYEVDSTNEYCFSAKCDMKKLNLREGNVILAKIITDEADNIDDVGLHFSVSNARDSILFFCGTNLGAFDAGSDNLHKGYAQIFIGSELKYWLNSSAQLNCFVWNRGKRKFKITDFEISIIDYWPKRWSWWE